MNKAKTIWAADLLHPLVLLAIFVLILNDHFLKGSGLLPGVVTGKLSDIAGLFFFPILLVAWLQGLSTLVRGHLLREKKFWAWIATFSTGIGFTAIKLSPSFNALMGKLWGVFVMDPTDLLTMPVLVLSYGFMTRNSPRFQSSRSLSIAQIFVLLMASAASIATPAEDPCRERKVRNFPVWLIDEPAEFTRDCAQFDVWVSRSGKDGLGLTIRAKNLFEDTCEVVVQHAEVRANENVYISEVEKLNISLAPGHEDHVYLPIYFPSNSLWNEGRHKGRVFLKMEVGGEQKDWDASIRHEYSGHVRTVRPCDDDSIHYIQGRR